MKKFLLKNIYMRALMLSLTALIAFQGTLYAAQPIEQVHAAIENALQQKKSGSTAPNATQLHPASIEHKNNYRGTIVNFLAKDKHITFAQFKIIINNAITQYIQDVLDPMIANNEYAAIRQCLIQFKNDLLNFKKLIINYTGNSAILLGTNLYKNYSHMMPQEISTQYSLNQLRSLLAHRLRCTGNGCKG